MVKSNKILRLIFSLAILLIITTVCLTAYRVWWAKDYNITFNVDCDPIEERCFVGEDDYYYKVANVNVGSIGDICPNGDIDSCTVPICDYTTCKFLYCGDPGSENYDAKCSQ